MKINKIAVIGSNSFAGSSFVNYVLENTDAQVIGISRSAENNPLFLPYADKKERLLRFKFYQLDLNKNLSELIGLFDNEQPNVIVNYAAQGEVRNSWKWPEQWYQTNCLSLVNLTNALKEKTYLQKYLHFSTPEVYGRTQKNIPETFNFNPSTPYAASRAAGDLFLLTLTKRYGFPVTMTRAANIYGPHQQLYRIIPRTIIYLKLGKKIQLHNNGKTERGFIHINDVSDATFRAITLGKIGEVYHISRENEIINLENLVKMICDTMGQDFKKSVELVEENFGQDFMYSLSSKKAQKELEWAPKIPLQQGIAEVIRWIENNWKEIQNQPLDYVHKA